MADVFGEAIRSYHLLGDDSIEIEVFSDLAGDEVIPVEYFFRQYQDMPQLEQKALQLSSGRILDVGAGSGAHSLYLQEQGFEVTALEKSNGCCDVMEECGVQDILEVDFFELRGNKYDTILLLMNGLGIAGHLERLDEFLMHCKSLLTKDGQILLESVDILYMYQDEEGGFNIDLNAGYYGNMNYTIQFGESQENFDWLYVSFDLLFDAAKKVGLKATKIMDGGSHNYLASLTGKA